MLTRPVRSIVLKGKDIVGKPAPSESTNKVKQVTVELEEGVKKEGWLKPLNADYTTVHMKYVIAISVILRGALGPRVSEELLVYDNEGSIVKTCSLNIPDFVPMQTWFEKDHASPALRELAVPTAQTLLKYKTPKLIVAAVVHEAEDLWGGNCGVRALVDLDMYYYSKISSFKKRKGFCEWGELTAEQLKPYSYKSRTYFPGQTPKNLFKKYKTRAFEEVKEENNAMYRYQWYTGLLEQLLAMDPILFKLRMQFYLGDDDMQLYLKKLGINLSSLRSATLTKLFDYTKPIRLADLNDPNLNVEKLSSEDKSKLENFCQRKTKFVFHNSKGEELTFIENCSQFFKAKHANIRKLALEVDEFKEFLFHFHKNPQDYAESKTWLRKIHAPSDFPYHPEDLEERYNTLLRDFFCYSFLGNLKGLNKIIYRADENNLFLKVEEEVEKNSDFAKSLLVIQGKKPHSVSQHLFNQIQERLYKLEASLNQTLTDYAGALFPSYQTNLFFRKKIENLLDEIELEHKSLTVPNMVEEINEDVTTIFKDITGFSAQVRAFLKDFSLSEPPQSPVALSSSQSNDGDYVEEDTFEDVEIEESKKVIYLMDHKDDLIEKLAKDLSAWVNSLSKEELKSHIQYIRLNFYNQSALYPIFGFFKPARGPEIDNLSLPEIFSEGKWNTTSLNTQLIKHLCLKMRVTDPCVYEIIHCKSQEDYWWQSIAEKVAKLYSTYAKKGELPIEVLVLP